MHEWDMIERTEYYPVGLVCTHTVDDREREFPFRQIFAETLLRRILPQEGHQLLGRDQEEK